MRRSAARGLKEGAGGRLWEQCPFTRRRWRQIPEDDGMEAAPPREDDDAADSGHGGRRGRRFGHRVLKVGWSLEGYVVRRERPSTRSEERAHAAGSV